ncbi:MAG: POTRA domain-containing protein [Planctomycetota bacterium]|jgi:outer membrane protein assembly factor BamA
MKKFHVCVLLISTALLLMTQPFSQAAEKPNAVGKFTVESIEFDSGEKKRSFKDKKLLEKLGFETGDDVIWAEPGRDNLEMFYHEKGFAFAQIDLKTGQLPDGKMKLTYKIDEGPKVEIGRISIRGNNALKGGELKQALKTTGKKWFFWSKNYLSRELTRDLNKLKGIYWDKGFLAHTITYSLSPDILDPAVIAQERTHWGQRCRRNRSQVYKPPGPAGPHRKPDIRRKTIERPDRIRAGANLQRENGQFGCRAASYALRHKRIHQRQD